MSADKFQKTPKQIAAIDLLASDKKYIALGGGSRSGKSFILVYALIVRACKVKSRHAIVRKTFNSVKRSMFLDTFPRVLSLCFPELKVKINRTDYIVNLPNGSEIYFLGLDDGPRTEKILGLELSTVYFNECSEIDYSSVQIALTRLAEKNTLSKKAFFDLNPSQKTHWSYYLFIKHLNPIDDVPLTNPEEYGYLRINPSENLANIDEGYIKLLESMPAKERIRFLDGEFSDESQGNAYYEFKEDRHVKSTTRQPGTIWLAQDYNISPGVTLVFQYLNDKFVFQDEIFLINSDTYKMVSELKSRGYSGCKIIPDSTGGNRRTSGKSDFDILKEAGFTIESTFNPHQTDRVINVNRLLALDRIEIDPKCKKLINDLHKVCWKDNKLDQKGVNKMLTHTSDALGYACWKLSPISPIVSKMSSYQR